MIHAGVSVSDICRKVFEETDLMITTPYISMIIGKVRTSKAYFVENIIFDMIKAELKDQKKLRSKK
jgi:hypothetical protein